MDDLEHLFAVCDAPFTPTGTNPQLAEFLTSFATGDISDGVTTRAYAGLDKSLIRSVNWRVLLRCLPARSNPPAATNLELLETWPDHISAARQGYYDLRAGYPVLLEKIQQNHAERVSTGNDDEEDVAKLVTKDLNRLDLGEVTEKFFRHPTIQQHLRCILLTWAVNNTAASYRQGMHEVLAAVVMIVLRDARWREREDRGIRAASLDGRTSRARAVLQAVLDFDHWEADAYLLFRELMVFGGLQYWYFRREVSPAYSPSLAMAKRLPFFEDEPCEAHSPTSDSRRNLNSPIVVQSRYIFSTLLKHTATYLHRHLEDLEIEPQVFMLRWLRLLFLREFPLETCLVLWDAIFADLSATGNLFHFIPWLCVVMLHYLEQDLLIADYGPAVKKLMKYPVVNDAVPLVTEALKYAYPNGSPVQRPEIPTLHPLTVRHRAKSRKVNLFDEDEEEEPIVKAPSPPPSESNHYGIKLQLLAEHGEILATSPTSPVDDPVTVRLDPVPKKQAKQTEEPERPTPTQRVPKRNTVTFGSDSEDDSHTSRPAQAAPKPRPSAKRAASLFDDDEEEEIVSPAVSKPAAATSTAESRKVHFAEEDQFEKAEPFDRKESPTEDEPVREAPKPVAKKRVELFGGSDSDGEPSPPRRAPVPKPAPKPTTAIDKKRQLFGGSDSEEETPPRTAAKTASPAATSPPASRGKGAQTFELEQDEDEPPAPVNRTEASREVPEAPQVEKKLRDEDTGKVHDPRDVCQRLRVFIGSEAFSDMKFQLPDGSTVPAHRCIVSALSPTLKELVFAAEFNGTVTVVGNEEQFRQVLSYMYTGEIQLRSEAILNLFPIVHEYRLEALQRDLVTFMLVVLKPANALQFFELAVRFTIPDLEVAALKICRRSLQAVLKGAEPHLAGLSRDTLLRLLQSKDVMGTIDEVKAFSFVVAWAEATHSRAQKEEFLRHVQPLLQCIDYSRMHPSDLRDTVRPTGLLSLEEYAKALEEAACNSF